MTDRPQQPALPDRQAAMMPLFWLWEMPFIVASRCLGLMIDGMAMMAQHHHAAFHADHDQLIVPPEIEVDSEQCLFA
ncbi:hypothetical protein O4H52_05800 [Sphingomonadaceae bacterium G21617-S1]|nr:hypothetical protein [Sphingomonadaceae bacterium G21617-S1]